MSFKVFEKKKLVESNSRFVKMKDERTTTQTTWGTFVVFFHQKLSMSELNVWIDSKIPKKVLDHACTQSK